MIHMQCIEEFLHYHCVLLPMCAALTHKFNIYHKNNIYNNYSNKGIF